MALGIFKKAWNTTQLSDLTDYLTSNLLSKANSNNTASGVASATINGLSGVIQYSQSISANNIGVFQFTNTSVTSNSIILFSLKYADVVDEYPYVQSYSISGNIVTVKIANSGSTETNQPLFLNFLIVN